MRKLLILALALAVGAIAFADDALVLPKGVLRFYLAPAYGFINEMFDDDAERQDMPVELDLVNVGLALEYGVTDQVSIAVQWVPGYTVWSKTDPEAPIGDATVNGPFDIFAGAKIQILGPKAFVPNETMRFAVAPGVVIPTPGADASEQTENMLDDEKFVLMDLDRHAFGAGARLYFDYVVNEAFFVNLYAEYIYFFEKEYDDSLRYGDFEVKHGYSLNLELEPQYQAALAEGITGQVALAAVLGLGGEDEVEGTGQENDGYLFSLRPNASVMFMNTPVPLEFKASYSLPLMGKNDIAANFFVLEGRVYLKF
jgi:hypothetical protein